MRNSLCASVFFWGALHGISRDHQKRWEQHAQSGRARGVYRVAASGLNANETFACGAGRCARTCNAPRCWWLQCGKRPTRSAGIRIRSSPQFRVEPDEMERQRRRAFGHVAVGCDLSNKRSPVSSQRQDRHTVIIRILSQPWRPQSHEEAHCATGSFASSANGRVALRMLMRRTSISLKLKIRPGPGDPLRGRALLSGALRRH